MDTERFEELISLSIGELREMLAYEDSEATFESFLVENGWIDEDDADYDDDDWDEDEDPYLDEDDEVCKIGSEPLTDSEAESLAVTIAEEIYLGKYDFSAIESLYSDEMLDRINYLAN